MYLDDQAMSVFGIGCFVLAMLCLPYISDGMLEFRAYKTRRDIARPARNTSEREILKEMAHANLKKGLGWYLALAICATVLVPMLCGFLIGAPIGWLGSYYRRQTRKFAPSPITLTEFNDDNIHLFYPEKGDS